MAVKRGCGTRVKGGVYIEVQTSEYGHYPLEFTPCPVMLVDMAALGIGPRGVHLANDKHGTTHVYDWVGREHYPEAPDILEEGFRFGFSRRAEGIDWTKITERSLLVLVHARALIESPDYRDYLSLTERPVHEFVACPHTLVERHQAKVGERCKIRVKHHPIGPMCARFWWSDLEHGETEGEQLRRTLPSFSYTGYASPDCMETTYAPGVLIALPIRKIAVIRDPDQGEHRKKFEPIEAQVQSKGIKVELVDE